jgi:hypothetical protein
MRDTVALWWVRAQVWCLSPVVGALGRFLRWRDHGEPPEEDEEDEGLAEEEGPPEWPSLSRSERLYLWLNHHNYRLQMQTPEGQKRLIRALTFWQRRAQPSISRQVFQVESLSGAFPKTPEATSDILASEPPAAVEAALRKLMKLPPETDNA